MKPLCFLKIGPRVHQEIYILVIEAEKIKISEIFWGKFLPDKNFPPLHPLYNKSNSLLSSLLSWVGVGGAGARDGGRGRGVSHKRTTKKIWIDAQFRQIPQQIDGILLIF